MVSRPRILFILTSADKITSGKATVCRANRLCSSVVWLNRYSQGWYLPEAAHPYYELYQQADIDFAAPKGPNPPVDENSVKTFANDDGCTKCLRDDIVKEKLANTKYLKDVKADDYDAIFYVGGHGPVIDLPTDPVNIKLAEEVYAQGKIVSAVCHGPACVTSFNEKRYK